MRRMYSHPDEYRNIFLANYLCIGFVPGGISVVVSERMVTTLPGQQMTKSSRREGLKKMLPVSNLECPCAAQKLRGCCHFSMNLRAFCRVLGGPGLLLSGLLFAPASEIKKSEIRNSKQMEPQKWFPCRHNSGTNHRNGRRGKLFFWRGDLNFRDAATSGTNHRTLRAQRLKKFNLAWIFNVAWNFQSRSKISILTFRIPHKYSGFAGRLAWIFQSRLKISIPEGDLEFSHSFQRRAWYV